jgi:hypothetical protein
MPTITLSRGISTDPDYSGLTYYVPAGEAFDADHFADACCINRGDIDNDDIKATQDRAAQLNPGEWMAVEYQFAPDA